MANYNSTHTGAQIDQAVDKALIYDNQPTQNSAKLALSGGIWSFVKAIEATIYSVLSGKQNALSFDDIPTQGSTNPVKSNGIWAEFQNTQSKLTFDNAPTAGSSNPVKSGGVKTAINNAESEVNANIADTFDPTETYGEDDFVIKDKLLYKFLSEAEHLVYRTIDNNVYRDADGKIYRAAPVIVWDGEDVVQTALANEVTKLFHRVPIAPSADGTYSLKVTVTDGLPSYSWVAD